MNSASLNSLYRHLKTNESIQRARRRADRKIRVAHVSEYFIFHEPKCSRIDFASDTDCTEIGDMPHAKIPTESPTSFTISSNCVCARARPESPDRYSIIRENKRPSLCAYIAKSACQSFCICSVGIVIQIARLHNNHFRR